MSDTVIEPRPFAAREISEIQAEIREIKRRYAERLVILGHHYQRKEIVDVADFRGDSFDLSRRASEEKAAEFIVFCGVRFMVESAAILARDDQKVFHPNSRAGCPMADMSDLDEVERAWEEMGRVVDTSRVVPITYMNSWAELKAFCGEHGGAACTSSNATKIFEWAFSRGDRILFFPDEHLGRNTARSMGIPKDAMRVFDSRKKDGGLTREEIERSRVLLWKGFCHVHTWFTTAHIDAARAQYPGCRVIVHPECTEEVVLAADAVGSTNFIARAVHEAPPGSVLFVGTEINMVHRLGLEYPGKIVLPLSRSMCPNMYRVDPENLLETLRTLETTAVPVRVPERVKAGARLALERMLAVK